MKFSRYRGRGVDGRYASMASAEERFRALVDTSGECWLWLGKIEKNGYGRFTVAPGKQESAHRFAYLLEHGEIPEGASILHACDNRPCVRPKHLFPGTQLDNMRDRSAKGRARNQHGASSERKPACGKGHPATPANTYKSGRWQGCRQCALDRSAAQRARRKAS